MRFSQIISLFALVWTLSGCELDPYCLTCREIDAGPHDAGAGRDGSGFIRADAGESDAGEEPDGCVIGGFERCNERDDDCDGNIDEGFDTDTSLEHCGGCNMRCAPLAAFGTCVEGVCQIESCDVGRLDLDENPENGCEYRCVATDPTDARCDRRDNDCDGRIDEDFDLSSDISNCGACGRICRTAHAESGCTAGACTIGACNEGYFDIDGRPENGCEYACVPATPATETCNLRDDDCDGLVDEGDPGGGASCGTNTGECAAGVERCVAGAIACMGGVSPTTEICNGRDDDCDSNTDEGNPEGGRYCGSGEGACEPGREQCMGGDLVCVGAVGPGTETCNAVDDDCDTRIDEGNPGGGAACGNSMGACRPGSLTCVSGSVVCMGGTGPTLETCNMSDDDCDGRTDEDFLLASDPRNCGMCGRTCSFPNAIAPCNSGMCGIGACLPGFVDADGNPTNGCEYACVPAGAEVCNGRDDDCDRNIDEGLTPPSTFCNPNGVCAGTTARCGGSSGWVCDYPASTYQATETRCDGLDNDCNGRIDDPFPSLGASCNNGELGECRRMGSFVCNTAGTATECSASSSSGGMAEVCNGRDDDCDGNLDEAAMGSWVEFSGSFGRRWIMSYEASRPDATASAAGSMSHRACSEAGRIPWTNVTYAQAQAACATQGARLCTEGEWQRACQTSASMACTWSYSSSCRTFSSTTCNGNEFDTNSSQPGDQDDVLATGAMSMCYADWGSSRRVYDLSGNVAEWAAARSSGVNPLRGGSSTSPSGGTACGFDFVVANDTFATPSVGFRCCRDTMP